MYNPCFERQNRYGKQYTEECDSTYEYANQLSKLKPYGGVDELKYGTVKEFENDTTLWYEPVTDAIDGFVLRGHDGNIIKVWT